MMEPLRKKLIKMGACQEALIWIGNRRSMQKAWNECPRADWMVWLVAKMVGKPRWPTHKKIMAVVYNCVPGTNLSTNTTRIANSYAHSYAHTCWHVYASNAVYCAALAIAGVTDIIPYHDDYADAMLELSDIVRATIKKVGEL